MENQDCNQDSIFIGAIFDNKKQLKKACQALATRENFEYTTTKSDTVRYKIKCSCEGCPWRMHAAKIGDAKEGAFEVRTIGEPHNCLGNQKLGHRQATATFLSHTIQEKLRDNASYRPKHIQQDIRREFGITIPYLQASRAKTAALQAINGTDEESYRALPKYCTDLLRNNPGSKIVLQSTPDEAIAGGQRFRRMFVCYSASAKGFVYCRPVLGLDGTHLKAKYRGILLAATALDVNGSLFPLASAVVSAENDENWMWFVQLLREIVEDYIPALLEPQALTFVSDRQKGLLESVGTCFPNSPHGYCLRHLYENMHKEFKHPMLKAFLWRAAKAITKEDFDKALEEIGGLHPRALPWLLNHADLKHWAEYYFPGHRYDH